MVYLDGAAGRAVIKVELGPTDLPITRMLPSMSYKTYQDHVAYRERARRKLEKALERALDNLDVE